MLETEGLTEIDLWRLSDSLSVTVAASLIAGHSPNDRFLSQYGDYRFFNDKCGAKERRFKAVFQSLRSAILANRLPADVRLPMRRGGNGLATMMRRRCQIKAECHTTCYSLAWTMEATDHRR